MITKTKTTETELRRVVKYRDKLSDEDFNELLLDAKANLKYGTEYDEILRGLFGVEPDYVFDLIEELEHLA